MPGYKYVDKYLISVQNLPENNNRSPVGAKGDPG